MRTLQRWKLGNRTKVIIDTVW